MHSYTRLISIFLRRLETSTRHLIEKDSNEVLLYNLEITAVSSSDNHSWDKQIAVHFSLLCASTFDGNKSDNRALKCESNHSAVTRSKVSTLPTQIINLPSFNFSSGTFLITRLLLIGLISGASLPLTARNALTILTSIGLIPPQSTSRKN